MTGLLGPWPNPAAMVTGTSIREADVALSTQCPTVMRAPSRCYRES
jgi:hypothetical protein